MGEEGYATRHLSRHGDEIRTWAHALMAGQGCKSEMLVWQAGLDVGMVECLARTAYWRARWHTLRRGGAAACWPRKPDLAYNKWWGRWQSTAVTLRYATWWKDLAVITPTILPVWNTEGGLGSNAARVGRISIWGRAMYLEVARALETPTKRKARPPRPKTSEAPGSPLDTGSWKQEREVLIPPATPRPKGRPPLRSPS